MKTYKSLFLEAANTTATFARDVWAQFSNSKPSLAMNNRETEGKRVSISLLKNGIREPKINALLWYDKKRPKITLSIGGILRVISFTGRKDTNGYYTKFSVLKTGLTGRNESEIELIDFLNSKNQTPDNNLTHKPRKGGSEYK